MNYNLNSWYGQLQAYVASQGIRTYGRIFVVVPQADANYQMYSDIFRNDSEGNVRLFTDIATAYAATTSDRNDVILLSANATHSLTTTLLIANNRVHFVWMDWWDRLVQQGTKIELAWNVAVDSVAYVTWTRCTFTNIKFIQSSTNAASLYTIKDAAEWSKYKNCSAIFWVVNNLGWTTAHEFLAWNDSATFIDCTFWCDTLLTSWARSVFHIKTLTTEFKSNQMRWCTFIISSSSWTATFIRLNAVTDILFTNIFRDCDFIASVDSAWWAAIAEAVQTWTWTNKWTLNFSNCGFFNCTKVSTATSGRNTAIQVCWPVPTALSSIGILPAAA